MRKTKRRDFIKQAGLGVTAMSFSAAVRASSPSGGSGPGQADRRLRLGMASYTFREFGLEETLAMTKRLGLKRIAFKSFHLPLDSSEDTIRRTAERVRSAGLELYGCGVVYMNNESEVHRAFAYARTGGMQVIIGVPRHDLLELVDRKVKETGIKVAIHNHGPGDELYPTPESAYTRIQRLDRRIGLCVDVGHTQRAGVDPAASLAEFADRVLDVHIKDVTAATGDGRTIEIGRGVIDIPRVCRTLLKIGFSGNASFEFEKDGKDPLAGVAESVGYVRGVLAVI